MACERPQSLLNGATLVGPLVIVFVVLGMATDHWVDTDVDRDKLSNIERTLSNSNQEISRIFHTRHKGLLRECYPDDDALFLDNAENVVGDDCFYIDYEDPDGDLSSNYETRMHLLRSYLATYVLGLVCVILSFVLGLILCLAKSCHLAHATSICSFLGALCVLAAIVFFHALEYVEANKDGNSGEIVFHNTWSKRLLQATDSELGYSYALAWVGFILALINGVLYILAARALRLRQISDDGSSVTSSTSDRKSVMKKAAYENNQAYAYDNYGMKFAPYPAALGVPNAGALYADGYLTPGMQALPAVPAMPYVSQVHVKRHGDRRSGESSEQSRDA